MVVPVLSNNYANSSLLHSFPVRFITLAGKTIAKEPGEQRGLLKSGGTIFKELLSLPNLSNACFTTDSMVKVLGNAENLDRIRTTDFSNDWRGIAERIKTYCNLYYFFETAVKLTYKLEKVQALAKVITPLAWATLIMDLGLAMIEIAESAIELRNPNRFFEWQHSYTKIEESKRKYSAAAGADAEVIKNDHVRKHRIRFWSHTFDYAKDWCNVAFQISLSVMFCFLAAPLIGGTIGTGAAVSCGIVAFFGISKLLLKVTSITLEDGLKANRRVRAGHFKLDGVRAARNTPGAVQAHPVLYTPKRPQWFRPASSPAAA